MKEHQEWLKEKRRKDRCENALILQGDQRERMQRFSEDLCQAVGALKNVKIIYDEKMNITVCEVEGRNRDARWAARIFGKGYFSGMCG